MIHLVPIMTKRFFFQDRTWRAVNRRKREREKGRDEETVKIKYKTHRQIYRTERENGSLGVSGIG